MKSFKFPRGLGWTLEESTSPAPPRNTVNKSTGCFSNGLPSLVSTRRHWAHRGNGAQDEPANSEDADEHSFASETAGEADDEMQGEDEEEEEESLDSSLGLGGDDPDPLASSDEEEEEEEEDEVEKPPEGKKKTNVKAAKG